ncbi:MAG: hypothetical protein ACYS26_19805, partial [Planctomycetota bacterium]
MHCSTVALVLALAAPLASGQSSTGPEAVAATFGSIVTVATGDATRLVCSPPEASSLYTDACASTTGSGPLQMVTIEINVFGLTASEISSVGVYQGNFMECGPLIGTLPSVGAGGSDICGFSSTSFAGGTTETVTATFVDTLPMSVFPLAFDGLKEGEVFYLVFPSSPSDPVLRGQLTIPLDSAPQRKLGPVPSGLDFYFHLNPGSNEVGFEGEISDPSFSTGEGNSAVAELFVGDPAQGGQPFATLPSVSPTRWEGSLQNLTSTQITEYTSQLWWLRVTSTSGAVDDRQIVRGTLNASPQTIDTTFGGTQGLWIEAGPEFAGGLYLILGSMTGSSPATLIPDGQGSFLGGLLGLPLVIDSYFDLTLTAALASPAAGAIAAPFGTLNSQGKAKTVLQLPPGIPA